jgi:hypothetical protein
MYGHKEELDPLWTCWSVKHTSQIKASDKSQNATISQFICAIICKLTCTTLSKLTCGRRRQCGSMASIFGTSCRCQVSYTDTSQNTSINQLTCATMSKLTCATSQPVDLQVKRVQMLDCFPFWRYQACLSTMVKKESCVI